jgi:hypothetical protein
MFGKLLRILLVSLLVACTVTNRAIVPSEYLVRNEHFLSLDPEVVMKDIEACQKRAPREVSDMAPDARSILIPILFGIGLLGFAFEVEYGTGTNQHQHPQENGVVVISAASVLVFVTVVATVIYLYSSSKYKKDIASKIQHCLESLGYEVRS